MFLSFSTADWKGTIFINLFSRPGHLEGNMRGKANSIVGKMKTTVTCAKWHFFFKRRGTTGMEYFCLMMKSHIWLTMMKGRIILLLFTSLTVIPLPLISLRLATHKENIIAGLYPLPWTSKRNYKVKYKNILWTPLCFSSAGHKYLGFTVGVTTNLLVC